MTVPPPPPRSKSNRGLYFYSVLVLTLLTGLAIGGHSVSSGSANQHKTVIAQTYSNPADDIVLLYDDTTRGEARYTIQQLFRNSRAPYYVGLDAKADGTRPEEYQLCESSSSCSEATPGNHWNGTLADGWDYGGQLSGPSSFEVGVHYNFSGDQPPGQRTVRMSVGGVEGDFDIKGRKVGIDNVRVEPVGGSTDQIAVTWDFPTWYLQPIDFANPTQLAYSERSSLPTIELIWHTTLLDFALRPNEIDITSDITHDLPDQRQGISFAHQASNPTEIIIGIGLRYSLTSLTHKTDLNTPESTTPTALTSVEKVNSNQIKVSFVDDYTDSTNTISQWQYRIGTEPTTPQGTNPFQTTWTTQDWTNICTADLGTDTGTGGIQLTTFTITGPQPHETNNCGDNQAGLDGGNYRIHLRGIDNTQTNRQHVRQYVSTNLTTITAPPTTTPTTPATQPPVTTPTTPPPATTPTTPPTATTPTIPTNTNPTTPTQTQSTTPNTQTPSPTTQPQTQPTQPPAPTGGGGGSNTVIQPNPSGNNIQITGNDNTVIIGDQNTVTFTDTIGHTHETNIGQLAQMGVTRGCNPPDNTRFCPDRAVTRAEMATFMVRAFDLAPTDHDPFDDTSGNVHATNINRMATAGISRGCNPPVNSRFCPERAVTRAEMATFITRVLELDETGDTDFGDTTGNVHSTNIQRFATAGITRGCNPPENSRYCPERAVTRAEMATFLVRSTSLTNS